jgi:cell division protein FtsB
MSKAANERPEFLALEEETNTRMLEFQNFLTGQIIKATKIECESLAEQLRDGFVKSLRITVEGFLLGDDSLHGNNCDATVSAMMESRSDRLLCHTTFNGLESFCDRYKQIHNLSAFPIQQQNTTAATTIPQSRFFQSTTAASTSRNTPVSATNNIYHNLDNISRIIESIFIAPFDEYLAQCKKNKIALELKRLSTSRFTEESTAQTQMELDREPSLDRSQLQDLIKKQAQAENKSLVKEIEKLRQQIDNMKSKNNQRGQNHLGASSQKEMNTSSKKNQNNSQSRRQPPTQKAADANKDTRRNSKKQKTTKDKKNTGGSGRQSRTRRNK